MNEWIKFRKYCLIKFLCLSLRFLQFFFQEYIVLVNKKNDETLLRSGDLGGYVIGFPLNIKEEGTIEGVDDIYGIKILDSTLQPEMTGKWDFRYCFYH